jgi:hypothetical protein
MIQFIKNKLSHIHNNTHSHITIDTNLLIQIRQGNDRHFKTFQRNELNRDGSFIGSTILDT